MAPNPLEILKYLNKSNCGECGEKTCLAFAAAVSRGQKLLNYCPYVGEEILQQFNGDSGDPKSSSREREEVLNRLKDRLSKIDFTEASKRLDAPLKDGRLTLKVLGKNFSVDSKGTFFSEIHIHSWLTLPLLNYILDGKGVDPSGNWVPLRELKGGKDWARFFEHRCEKPMKKLADTYPDFFADMLHVFSGRQVDRHYESDVSLVLYPLPKLPILICYWRAEEGLESDLHLFFDNTAEENLNMNSIYSLITGMLVMFEKIARRHN
jgi:hypothetical protein